MWRAGWGDADGAGASAPTGARWESLQEEENQALFARSPLFPSSPVTTTLTRGRKRGQDVDNSPRPKSARSSSSDDLPPCDADANVSVHAEGQRSVQPPGSWTGTHQFHDEDRQRVAGVALEEGQDGSGHSLVNADGSRRSIKDTGDQEHGKDDDSDDSDDAKSVMTAPPADFETLCLSDHLQTHLEHLQDNAEDGDEPLADIRSYPQYVVQLQEKLRELNGRTVNECSHWARKDRSKLLELIFPATTALGVSRRDTRRYIRGNEKAVSETMPSGRVITSIFSPEFADRMLAALEKMSEPPSEADLALF